MPGAAIAVNRMLNPLNALNARSECAVLVRSVATSCSSKRGAVDVLSAGRNVCAVRLGIGCAL